MSEPVKVPIFRIELRMRINGTAKAYAMNAKKSTLSVCVLPNPGKDRLTYNARLSDQYASAICSHQQ